MTELGPDVAAPEPSATAGRSIIRSGLLSMLAVASLGVTRLVYQSVVQHHIGKDSFAPLAQLLSLATIASLLLPAGAASALSKFVPYERGRGSAPGARAVHRFLSRLGGAGAVVLGAAVAGVALLTHASRSDAVAAGLLAFSFSLYTLDKAALYGFDRVAPYTRLELSTSALTVLTTVVVVFGLSGGYLFPLSVGYSVFVVGARFLLRRDLAGEVAPAQTVDRREVGGFVALACLGTLASTGFTQGMPLLAGTVSTEAVADFGAVVGLIAPMYFLPRALNLALFPAMAHAQGAGDTAAVRRHTDVSTRALILVLAPVFGVAMVLAREILTLAASAKYANAAPVFQIVLAGTYLSVVQVAAVNALSSGSQRQVRIPVLSSVAGAALGSVSAVLLARPLGSVGVALAYLLGTAFIGGGPIIATWRLHRMTWRGVVVRAAVVLAAAGGAGAWLDRSTVAGWGHTAAAVGTSLVLLVGAAAMLRSEVAALVRGARTRA